MASEQTRQEEAQTHQGTVAQRPFDKTYPFRHAAKSPPFYSGTFAACRNFTVGSNCKGVADANNDRRGASWLGYRPRINTSGGHFPRELPGRISIMSMGLQIGSASAGRVDRMTGCKVERSRRRSLFAVPPWLCLVTAAATLVMSAPAADAASMNKCVINGTVTYQQAPCPSTQPRKDPTLEELNAAEKARRAPAASAAAATRREAAPAPAAASSRFSCDGRTRCTQMRSCEEAKYFLDHCPGVQMDGDGDGVPCEQQWCH